MRRGSGFGVLGSGLALLLIAGGLLAIGLGWNGAAGAGGQVAKVPDLRAQIPWLLSGGFLGLGLIVIGAGLMVTESHRTDRALLEAKLDELITTLRANRSEAGTVVAGASSYHRPDCRLVRDRDTAESITLSEAEQRNLTPCRVCHPDVDLRESSPKKRRAQASA